MSTDASQSGGGPLQELRQKLIEHAHFLRGRGGSRLDMRDQELTRLVIDRFKFDFAWFGNCLFSFSSFSGASFVEAKLTNTAFVHCNLSNCDFSKAELRGISIHHSNVAASKLAQVRGAEAFVTFDQDGDYRIDFRRNNSARVSTDFSNSDFRGADLTGAKLRGGVFRDANLQDAIMAQADLEGADMSGANLIGANFTGANVKELKLEGAAFSLDDSTRKIFAGNKDFEIFAKNQQAVQDALKQHEAWALSGGVTGAKANFRGQSIKGGDFRYRTLAAMDFSDTTLRACLFNEAVLAAANFSGAQISYCNFDQVDARGIKLSDADVKFSSFVDADFSELSIQGRAQGVAANLFGTLFTSCNMTRAKVTAEHLREARFVSCKR